MKAITLLASLFCCCTITSQTWDHPFFTMRIAQNMRSSGGDISNPKEFDKRASRQVGEYIHNSSVRLSPYDHPARVTFDVKTWELNQKQIAVAEKFVKNRLERDNAKVVDTIKTDNGLVVTELFSVWSGVDPMGKAFSINQTTWFIQGKYRVYEFAMFSEFDNKFYRDRLGEFRGYVKSFKEK